MEELFVYILGIYIKKDFEIINLNSVQFGRLCNIGLVTSDTTVQQKARRIINGLNLRHLH